LGEEFSKINPSQKLPYFVNTNEKQGLSQSLAILNYLEEKHPNPQLQGKTLSEKIKIIELAEIINADTAPLQIPSVQAKHSNSPEEKLAWTQFFIRKGLSSFSKQLPSKKTFFSVGDTLSWAELCLIPQLYNAHRYKVKFEEEFPRLNEIYKNCQSLDSFQSSKPENQKDAV